MPRNYSIVKRELADPDPVQSFTEALKSFFFKLITFLQSVSEMGVKTGQFMFTEATYGGK
jgi:hypothetical protein